MLYGLYAFSLPLEQALPIFDEHIVKKALLEGEHPKCSLFHKKASTLLAAQMSGLETDLASLMLHALPYNKNLLKVLEIPSHVVSSIVDRILFFDDYKRENESIQIENIFEVLDDIDKEYKIMQKECASVSKEALFFTVKRPYFFNYRKPTQLTFTDRDKLGYFYLYPLLHNHLNFTKKAPYTVGVIIDLEKSWHSFSVIMHVTDNKIEFFYMDSLKNTPNETHKIINQILTNLMTTSTESVIETLVYTTFLDKKILRQLSFFIKNHVQHENLFKECPLWRKKMQEFLGV